MKRLRDRVAVMTGAASGIGRALAFCLADRGSRLALVDWNAGALEEVVAALRRRSARLSVHCADVSSRPAMEQLAQNVIGEHGECHLLVNNAGVAVDGTIAEVPLENFEWIVGVNFWGVVRGCQASSARSSATPFACASGPRPTSRTG